MSGSPEEEEEVQRTAALAAINLRTTDLPLQITSETSLTLYKQNRRDHKP